MSNKLIGLTLIVVSWITIEVMVANGHGNIIAGWVLSFACGMLGGNIMATKK